MTHVYQWFALPAELVVRCAACGGRAVLSRADPRERDAPLRGRLACHSCGRTQASALLSWPEDAYYQGEVKGQLLWAWSEAHVRAIRAFVASTTRNPADHPGFVAALHHLPTHFLRASNRPATLKALDRMLGAEGCRSPGS